jgi:meiotically up-regulated gene 157 (Mug157) protein
VKKTETTILHYPRLDTVLMVEDAIKDVKEYPTRTELWKSLPKKVQYQTFKLILEYLEKSNKIIFTKDNKIMWIYASSKALKELIATGMEY